jgi:hypothetical protein
MLATMTFSLLPVTSPEGGDCAHLPRTRGFDEVALANANVVDRALPLDNIADRASPSV